MTFIDGYNLLFHLDPEPDDVQQAREALISQLSSRKYILVFDAPRTNEPPARHHIGELEVVYTGPNESADAYIIAEVERKGGGLVVTDDNGLARQVKWAGGKVQSTENFLKKNIKSD